MFHIDKKKIDEEIRGKNPKIVAFSAPDGLLSQTAEIMSWVQEKYGIEAYLIADPCWGTCDTTDEDARKIGADIVFNIGHTVIIGRLGRRTSLIDAYDDISFDEVLLKAIPLLREFTRVGLATSSQHLRSLEDAKSFLEQNQIPALLGHGKGQLNDGQVFGCEFYSVFDIKNEVDAFVFLGQSRFHALGVMLSTGKPTFMVDPYLAEVVNISELAEKSAKKAVLTVYKALDAERFGVILGLKEGQLLRNRASKIKKQLEDLGKSVQLIAIRDVTPENLVRLRNVDAFIQTACPRISTDGYVFDRPVLSVPQADALMELLQGRNPTEFFEKPHWL
ncbi:MAG: diphthamide biosynthesis enzyme Dph2 [Thaumarchaeota archaeon]|nr:diphthamide biosynthesis enzyme Dph2 [Nitrososphaerota archaeon]